MPAFNEAPSIESLIAEIHATQPSFDVAVIDDGSSDSTSRIALAAGAIVLELPFNLGIGGAVQAGFIYAAEAGYDVAVQVDGDGQHDPAQIDLLLDPLDLLLASRARADRAGSAL